MKYYNPTLLFNTKYIKKKISTNVYKNCDRYIRIPQIYTFIRFKIWEGTVWSNLIIGDRHTVPILGKYNAITQYKDNL
jgi:hypothetical protein